MILHLKLNLLNSINENLLRILLISERNTLSYFGNILLSILINMLLIKLTITTIIYLMKKNLLGFSKL